MIDLVSTAIAVVAGQCLCLRRGYYGLNGRLYFFMFISVFGEVEGRCFTFEGVLSYVQD